MREGPNANDQNKSGAAEVKQSEEEMHTKCCAECKEGMAKDRSGAKPDAVPCADFTDTLKPWCLEHFRSKPVMASACLPWLFHAVEIRGEAYWDGGFTGNPALFPFFDGTVSEDILLVQVNPIRRDEIPTSGHDIMERVQVRDLIGDLTRIESRR